jgi:hypothetical protein
MGSIGDQCGAVLDGATCGLAVSTIMVAVLIAGCPPPVYPTPPPVDPVLEAVVMPGPWLPFARNRQLPSVVYEVLPNPNVILLMASKYDFSKVNVTIKYLSDESSTPLELVERGATDRKLALDEQGFFEFVFDIYRYSVIVTPRKNERAGLGFDLVMVNQAANGTQSAPLVVRVRPRVMRTLPSDVFFDCGEDFDNIEGRYHRNCKNSESIVGRNITLQGWLIHPFRNCLGTLCVEDWHYDFVLDPDFIDSMYGRQGTVVAINGTNAAMESLTTKGNPPDTRLAGLPIRDVSPDGQPRGVTINSFALPLNTVNKVDDGQLAMIAELNAWHPAAQGQVFSRHWWGRGPAPSGWVTRTVPSDDPEFAAEGNAFWPFEPAVPDGPGRPGPLGGGPPGTAASYVRITGTLWQDSAHEEGAAPTPTNAPWSFLDARKGAWLEIHPVDWLERIPKARPPTKIPWMFQLISYQEGGKTKTAEFDSPKPSSDAGLSLRCRELIDGRLTDMSSVTSHSVTIGTESVTVAVTVSRRLGEVMPGDPPLQQIIPGRFKAAYIVWWDSGPPSTGCSSE